MMEADYVKLVGYKPLGLSGITEIEYTPQSPFQLILGTNGCGKTSFLSQLSMLPAVPGDYHEGGSKHWEGSHNGKRYILTSEIGKRSARHSFKVVSSEGEVEELNPGGTGAVQKELVQQHTKLTTELHDVLLGRHVGSKFTNMSPAKRQEWFQVLSPVDIREGMEVYQQFMQRSRQMAAVHKHAVEQFPEVSKLLLPDSERADLVRDIDLVKAELTEYMEAKIPLRDMNAGYLTPQALENHSRQILETNPGQLEGYRTLQSVRMALSQTTQQLEHFQSRYDQAISEYYELDKQLKALGGISDEELAVQQQRVTLLQNHLATFTLPAAALVADSLAPMVAQILRDRISELADALTALKPTKPEYAREQYVNALERRVAIEKQQDTDRNRMSHLQMELRRIDSTDNVVCPSCSTAFKPGIGGDVREQITHELTMTDARQAMLRTEYFDLTQYVEEVDGWRQIRQTISRLLSEQVLQPYRAAIIESPHFSVGPKMLLAELRYWMPVLDAQIERFNLQTELSRVEQTYQLAVTAHNQARQQNLSVLNTQFEKLEQQVAALLDSLNTAKQKHRDLIRIEKTFLLLDDAYHKVKQTLDQHMEQEVFQAKVTFNNRMSELIANGQSRLAYLENRLRAAEQAENTLNRLRDTMDDAQRQAKAAQELATLLSPKEGLVAEYLSSSVNALTQAMNQEIAHVWTYEMEILPCGIDGGDLNYKFPLQIRGEEDDLVNDIGLGSDSQQTIINQAFRFVVMRYLGLENYPLYLDELGRDFDETHAVRVMQYIKYMVEAGKVTQVFLISHNPALHSMFTLADVNILHGDNITVSDGHNQCLQIN
jgi:energy-coupling factor transporter ATP-binding protein EcfA2